MIETNLISLGTHRKRPYRARYIFLLCLFFVFFANGPNFATAADEAPTESGKTEGDELPANSSNGSDSNAKAGLEISHEEYEQLIQEELVRQSPNLEITSLSAGDVNFIALAEPHRSDQQHGAILFLHDLGSNLNDVAVIQPLRESLPKVGWQTLSIQLPTVKLDDPKRIYLEMLDQINPRITSGLQELEQSQPKLLIIIAHGLGAAMALRYLDETAAANVNALIMISLPAANALLPDPKIEHPAPAESSPQNMDENTDATTTSEPTASPTKPASTEPELPPGKDLLTLLSDRQIPILDIYGERDFRNVLRAAAQRQRAMQQKRAKNFSQKRIAGAEHSYRGHETDLLRAIRGWLNKTFSLTR